MLPAVFHSISLIICLFVQSIESPLAGAWLPFHLAGCSILLYNGQYPRQNLIWYACLAWVSVIAISAFILVPVVGGAAWMWIIAAMPTLALCMKKEYIRQYILCFGGVITLFSACLIAQKILGVHYTVTDIKSGIAWPLMDPNNSAAVINFALIPCFYMALRNRRWGVAVIFFAYALLLTQSKAGAMAALVSCSIIAADRYKLKFILPASYAAISAVIYAHFFMPWVIINFLESFLVRIPIWQGSMPLLWARYWIGLGLGTFMYYYSFTRIETFTAGWHSHNDLLQFAIELGIPAALIFCFLVIVIAIKTSRENIVSACVMLVIFLQSMVEFQFYIAPVSMLMGLAIAYHYLAIDGRRRKVDNISTAIGGKSCLYRLILTPSNNK